MPIKTAFAPFRQHWASTVRRLSRRNSPLRLAIVTRWLNTLASCFIDCASFCQGVHCFNWHCEKMDHAVHFSMSTSRSQEFFSRCFKCLTVEKSFENRELESLYQRYIFKHEQSSLQSLLAIMSLMSISLASVHFYHAAASGNSTWLSAPAIYLTIQTLILLVPLLMIHSRRPVVTDAHLRALCWLCLFLCVTFVIVSAPIDIGYRHASIDSSWGRPQVPSQGAWEVVFVTFLIYSLLPIPTAFAMVTGFALSLGHVLVSCFTATLFRPLLINQVIPHTTLTS